MKSRIAQTGKILIGGTFVCLMAILPASCLKDIPESFPDSLVWNPQAAIPLGATDFGMDNSSGFDTTLLELDSISGLPQWVSEFSVVLEGSVEFNLTSIEQIENINRMLLRLNIHNGFPNEMDTQGYFLDGDQVVLDSVFDEGPLRLSAGSPVGDGSVIDPSFLLEDVYYEKQEIEVLASAQEIRFRAVLENPDLDSTLIPFYTSYRVSLDIGAMLDLTIPF